MKFSVDCSVPVEDEIMDVSSFVSFILLSIVSVNWLTCSGLGLPSLILPYCFVLQEQFLRDRIKVNGKTGNLGNEVTLSKEKNTIAVSSDIPFSKRYVYNCVLIILGNLKIFSGT